MEPIKKDFTPEQLENLLLEIDEAPHADRENLSGAAVSLTKRLGEEIEKIVSFGDNYSIKDVTAKFTPKRENNSEKWLYDLAGQKIDETLKQQNLGEVVRQVLEQVLPPIAEKLITQEIEKIKAQIEGL